MSGKLRERLIIGGVVVAVAAGLWLFGGGAGGREEARICGALRDGATEVSELGASREEFRDRMLGVVDEAEVLGRPWEGFVKGVVAGARGGGDELARAVDRLDGQCRSVGL